ncbi:MAG TPA: type 1 glutamine amidotransferase [Jatrophihabitans sp.]|nr:type 1 glutamine amidotransferase [Jatrophihabitans sp.]
MSQPRVLVVQNDASDPPARLGEWLAEVGLDLHVVSGPDLPADLDGFAGLVVLGGAMGATDDDVAPWLPRARALLREAVTNELPTLAVCLGAQLLAVAHGGRVELNPEGPELGAQLVAKRGAASTDPLFGSLPITPDVIQWHYDAITALPPGAVQLASSPISENQAYRLGRLAWGVQFHIETTPEIVREWAAEDAANLIDYDLDEMLRRMNRLDDDIVDVWRPFAHAFAEIVRNPESVRAARGVPTTTAAPITDPQAIRAALAAELDASRTSLPTPSLRPQHDD